MPSLTLRFVTYLAPNMLPVYAFLVRYVAARLGVQATLATGRCYTDLPDKADVSLVCSLPYIHLARLGAALAPIAAPVLRGERYGGRPVYYSDVIVHRDSPFQSFADLRGGSWCYNEPWSQSGYGITRQRLIEMGETNGFFSKVIQAGFHERSIRLVAAREVDASAIDSQVLAIMLRDHPELASQIRVIESLGPSTIQPVVASRRLPESLREDLRAALVDVANETEAPSHLGHGFIDRFVPIDEDHYEDIRSMLSTAEACGFLALK